MTFTHTVWAERVATDADLPDLRLQSRLTAILVDTLEHPSASIPQATGDAGQAKATYRFYANPRVTTGALHQAFAAETARRCLDHDAVLVVQDTTTLNFTGLQHSIPELGPIDSGGLARGVHLHTGLALTLSGQIIGILDQQYWARPQPGRPGPEEKESGKWINGIDASRAILYETAGGRPVPRLIHVMDREGDTYEVMMTVVDSGDSAIIRCAQDRRIDDPLARAHAAVRSRPALCREWIEVSRKAGVPARYARVEVRSMRVKLLPDLEKYPHARPMTWNLVEVWEPRRRPGPSRCIGCSGARAGDDCGRSAGGGAEIYLPVADRGDPLDAEERLRGGGTAVEDVGRTGEGRDGECGGGGANRVVAGSGARDARGAGAAGLGRG